MLKILRQKRFLAVIIIIILIAGGYYFLSGRKNGSKSQKTHAVKLRDLSLTITLPGEISAHEKVNLRFQGSGRLAWVGVKEGDTVQKYQALASLDKRELKNRLDKYLNTFVKTRLDFDQTKDDELMTSTTGLSREIRDEAKRLIEKSQYDLNSSVLDVELQALSMEYATLTTPIAGIVTNIDKSFAGENVTPTTAEIEVINPASLYFAVSADQSEVVSIKEGMTAEITFDPFDDAVSRGTVRSIAFTPTTGETSTVYEIDLEMERAATDSGTFRIGMTGDATFVIKEKKSALSVDSTAIIQENGKKFVLKSSNGRQVKTEIATGEEYDTYTEILSGLSEGDTVYD